jgi:ParB-like chromosome segregation protein Spo0J
MSRRSRTHHHARTFVHGTLAELAALVGDLRRDGWRVRVEDGRLVAEGNVETPAVEAALGTLEGREKDLARLLALGPEVLQQFASARAAAREALVRHSDQPKKEKEVTP